MGIAARAMMSDQPVIYEIRVTSHLDERHLRQFEGLAVTHLDTGETAISGQVADRAALQGLLNHLSDLGLTLIAVNRLSKDDQGSSE